MWIVYVVNGAAFWLVAGEVYRVGKRDCHIVIENDRSISRTHLSIELGAPACLTSTQQQQQQQQGTSCITPITLIDSSTYGTVLCAEGHRPDSTHSATPGSSSSNNNNSCVYSDVQQRVPALLHCAPRARCEVTTISLASAQTDSSAQVECCVCCYDENNSGAGRSGDKTSSNVAPTENAKVATHATGAEDDVAVVLEQRLRLTKGTPLHIPVQLADWRVFSAILGNHRATLRFVWWDATAMVQDVPCEMQMKLQHALAYCGVRVISLHDVPAQTSSPYQRDVIVNAAEEGDEQLTLDEADTDMRAECNAEQALLPLCERYRDSTHASSQRPQTREENSEHHFYHGEFPIQHSTCMPHYGAVDYYVTSTLTPSIPALAMLCRGVPIVAPSFFLALRQRCCGCSCASSTPPHDTDVLPDMAQHLPTLHASWSLLEEYLRRTVPEASIQSTTTTSTWQHSLLTQPQQRQQRRDLFAAWRFVLFQRSLYDEVRQYLPFTQAILCYDAQLQNMISQEHVEDREVKRQSVVLYSETEAPFMTGEAGNTNPLLPSVEYAELMYCLLTMSSLHPHPLRHYATSAMLHDDSDEKKHKEEEGQRRTSTRTSDGRRTDADPLFPDVAQRAGQSTEEEDAKEKSAGDGRHVSRHGWITRHTAPADTVVMQDKAKDTSITHNNTSSSPQTLPSPSPLLVVDTGQGTRELPAYPCFLLSTALTSKVNATNLDTHVPLTVRPFKKQKIAHGGPIVELVALEPSVGAAPEGVNTTTTTTTIATRVPRVEAMDLLSEHVTMGPGPMAVQPQQQQQTTLNFASAAPRRQVAGPQTTRSSGSNATAEAAARFNSYDVAMHHALHRRRATRHMTEPHTRHPVPTATATTSERNAERRTAVRHVTTAVNDVDEEEDVDIGDEDVAEGQANARQTSKGRRMYNVFDIDGLF